MIDYASVKFVRDHTTVLKFFEGGGRTDVSSFCRFLGNGRRWGIETRED